MRKILLKNPELTLKQWKTLIKSLMKHHKETDILLIDSGRSDCQLIIKE